MKVLIENKLENPTVERDNINNMETGEMIQWAIASYFSHTGSGFTSQHPQGILPLYIRSLLLISIGTRYIIKSKKNTYKEKFLFKKIYWSSKCSYETSLQHLHLTCVLPVPCAVLVGLDQYQPGKEVSGGL